MLDRESWGAYIPASRVAETAAGASFSNSCAVMQGTLPWAFVARMIGFLTLWNE